MVFAVVLAAGVDVIPHWFTGDQAVVHATRSAWPYFAAMMPAAGIVFALDGVFIGAGDVAFLRSVTLVAGFCFYVPIALVAYFAGLGLGGVWLGLTCFVGVRFVAALLRLRSGDWVHAGLRDAVSLGAELPPA